MKSRVLAVLGGLMLCVTQAGTWAQSYPSRPVRLVVGFPAGGGSDIATRRLGERLQPRLGQPVIVENRPGAGAAIAAQTVVQAEPDGYTLYSAGGSSTAFKVFNRDLTFDVQKDLAPIGKFANSVAMLVINAKLPARTLQEFIAYAKANPGKLNYGTPGATVRLAFESMRQQAGLDMVHVQYKGAADYSVALLADQVQIIIDTPGTQQGNLEAGKVRFLAVTTKTRSDVYPNVPTVSESGLPGWEYSNWNALLAPVKTPRAIIDRLSREVAAIVTSDEYKADILKWSKGSYQAESSTPEELAATIARDTKFWGDIAQSAKIE